MYIYIHIFIYISSLLDLQKTIAERIDQDIYLADKHTFKVSSLRAAPICMLSALTRVWHHKWPRVVKCDTTCNEVFHVLDES